MGKIADFILGHDFDPRQSLKDLCSDAYAAAKEALSKVMSLEPNVRAQHVALNDALARVAKLEEAAKIAEGDRKALGKRIAGLERGDSPWRNDTYTLMTPHGPFQMSAEEARRIAMEILLALPTKLT